MCGIILKINKDRSANEEVLNQFQDQIQRGSKGFGMMTIEADGKFAIHRATSEVLACVNLQLKESNGIIFHHRYPTNSTNKISQTHPILISDKNLKYDYYLMHNGIISNTALLFDKHVDAGLTYSTYEMVKKSEKKEEWQYNDSESLGFELAMFIEAKSSEVCALGGTAFILAQVEKQTQTINQIFFGRNSGRPLKMYKRNGEIMLSSEGKGSDIETNLLYSFDPKTDKMKLSKLAMVIKEEKITYHTSSSDWNWKPVAKKEEVVEIKHEYNEDVPNDDYDFSQTEMIEDEVYEAVAQFFFDLRDGNTNPFVVDPKDCLRQISLLLKDAVALAQDDFIKAPSIEVFETNAK